MEAKIEALEPRTSGALFFLFSNHLGNQHKASQRVDVSGSGSVVLSHRMLIAKLWCDVSGEVAPSGQWARLTDWFCGFDGGLYPPSCLGCTEGNVEKIPIFLRI